VGERLSSALEQLTLNQRVVLLHAPYSSTYPSTRKPTFRVKFGTLRVENSPPVKYAANDQSRKPRYAP
jgi:hypothetical protein